MQMAYMESGRINGTVYRKRLLLPIYDNGNLISIEGRDVTSKQSTKVLYPKDSSVNTLYDLDKLDDSKPIYVVEGLLDLAVLRTDPFFANSTAIFGAQVTRRQMWLLNQFDSIILIPDNDKAGRNTTRKMIEELDRPFQILDVPKLQDIKDVGDIPTKLHTSVHALRRRGWGRNPISSSTRVFH
jgi:DNA primase